MSKLIALPWKLFGKSYYFRNSINHKTYVAQATLVIDEAKDAADKILETMGYKLLTDKYISMI